MRNIDPKRFSPYESAFRPDVRLGDLAYSLCGGPCAGLFIIENAEMLRTLTERCISEGIAFRVVGGLSNLLVSDSGFDGIILLNRKGNISRTDESDGKVLLQADSGVLMSNVVNYCNQNALSGFEWACGLPGTVGGAVYGNAGAFGTETADIYQTGSALTAAGEFLKLDRTDLAFAYRSSCLKRREKSAVLLNSVFCVEAGDPVIIRSRGEANREKRHAGQPVGEPSLGSVFRNPEGVSAGKLIQDAGLKGMTVGKASVSMKHANFITTEKGVCSEDYRTLIRYIQDKVWDAFGIRLEPEIEMLGFEDQA